MSEMTRKHVNHTMYDHMNFPDYEFREFPMEVPVVGGVVQPTPYNERGKPHPTVRVNTPEELAALRNEEAEIMPTNYEGTTARVRTEDDEREDLLVRADQLGLKVDRRWGLERLRAAVEEPL